MAAGLGCGAPEASAQLEGFMNAPKPNLFRKISGCCMAVTLSIAFTQLGRPDAGAVFVAALLIIASMPYDPKAP